MENKNAVGEPVATVIKKGAERTWMSENLGSLPDGMYSLYLATPTQTSVPTDKRALFEAWATRSGPHVTLPHVFSFTRYPDRTRYLEGTTELCWRAWQASAAQASLDEVTGAGKGEGDA